MNPRLIYLLIFSLSCFQSIQGQVAIEKFQHILDTTFLAHPNSRGIMIHVEVPKQNISWTSAVGYADQNKEVPLHKDQPALIASNTKTFVSAAILKLIELGHFKWDEPIDKIIPRKTRRLLRKNEYNPKIITVNQLLSHTSGISDYVNEAYFEFVKNNPGYEWSRAEQIELAMSLAEPKKPGTVYSYADINYLLLGQIIEGQTQKPFYTSIRELLNLDELGLNTIHFAKLEEAHASSLEEVEQVYSKEGMNSKNIDPSWDLFGGGGQVSSTKDLSLFFTFLFEGKIIKDWEILSKMYSHVKPLDQTKNYCLGLYHFPSFHGHEAYYHGGWWGTDVMYLPQLGASISVFTLTKEHRDLNAQISLDIIHLLSQSE